jgi:hypothetical protein
VQYCRVMQPLRFIQQAIFYRTANPQTKAAFLAN